MAAVTVIRVQEIIINAGKIIGWTWIDRTKETDIRIWAVTETVIRAIKVGEWGVRVYLEVETERVD